MPSENKGAMKRQSKRQPWQLAVLAGGMALASCSSFPGAISVTLDQSDIPVLGQVMVRVTAYTPFGVPLEYHYAADRGLIDERNTVEGAAIYYAPYTGGPDRIQVAVFDRNEGRTIARQDLAITVNGESLVYAEARGSLREDDNATIRLTAVRGVGQSLSLTTGRDPQISPDGRYMAFVRHFGDGTSQIFVRDPAGGERNITNHPSSNLDPTWSPVASNRQLQLAFASDRIKTGSGQSQPGHGDRFSLWRLNLDSGDLRPVTSSAGSDREPNWSPDGRTIAFRSNLLNNQPGPSWNLWTVDVATGRLNQLTNETLPNKGAFEPAWAPSGTRLAYTRKYLRRQLQLQTDMQKIHVINPLRPTENGGFGQVMVNEQDPNRVESSASWSPDGNEMAMVQAIGTDSRVFRMQAVPPALGFNYDQLIEIGAQGGIEAQWARQNWFSPVSGFSGGFGFMPGF